MRRLIPHAADEPLEDVYGGLRLSTRPDRAWVALGMVASVDGAAAREGDSGALGGEADHQAFRALRASCDAVLVGAGTLRVERYGPLSGTPARRQRRQERGLAPTPRLVIVTGSLDLDPDAAAFSDRDHPPLVVTHDGAPEPRAAALAEVAEVVRWGSGRQVDLRRMLGELRRRGLGRVLCEGGPTLNGSLLEADLVDEVFLTLDPVLVCGPASRIVAGPTEGPARRLALTELREHGGELLLRYRRDRSADHGGVDGG